MACLSQLDSVPAAYAVVASSCDWPIQQWRHFVTSLTFLTLLALRWMETPFYFLCGHCRCRAGDRADDSGSSRWYGVGDVLPGLTQSRRLSLDLRQRLLRQSAGQNQLLTWFFLVFFIIVSVLTNSSTYYLNTIANIQEFSLFKIIFQ